MYRTEIVFGKIDARTVGATFQYKPLSVRRDFSLGSDEIVFGEAEIFSDPRYLGFIDPDDSVLYAATRSALTALEPHIGISTGCRLTAKRGDRQKE